MTEGGSADGALPRALGPLLLHKRLGAGGMGTAFEATVREPVAGLPTGARVAAKVFRDDVVAADASLQRLRREALLGATLRHPGLVLTHALVELPDGGRSRQVLLMELVEGTTLRRLLDDLGPLPEPMLRHFAAQLAGALHAVHSAGVVHRDVKPENVLVSATQQVKLSDLGIARPLAATTELTTTGAFLGSVAYASPEHFGTGALSARSDLYSLGVVLHEAACGRRPLEDETVAGLIRRHVEQRPRRLGELVASISPFFEELVATLLEKEPARRIPSAARLLEILTEGESSDWWKARTDDDGARLLQQQRAARPTPFVGRESELARLQPAAEAALAGEGGVVILEGEAGVGKSRLLDELLRRLQDASPTTLVLRGENPPGGSGRGAVAESLASRFGESGLRRLLEAHLPSPEAAAALAAWALGLPAPPGIALTRELVHAGLGRLAAGITDERPLLWVLEDLHFAQAEERALVSALARAARDHRMLVVATTRPGLPQEDVSALERLGALRVPLGRLSARAVVELLEESLGSRRLAEDLGGRVAAKTDGNPYFVLAVIQDLQEKGAVMRSSDGSWSAAGRISSIEVPTSVKSLLLERAAALSHDERAALDAAAVQGFHFEGDLVAEVLGLSRLAALQLLAAVERRTSLVRAAGARYQFDHHQLQEVLFDAIPAPLRVEYHALLARALAAREKPGVADGEAAGRIARHALLGDLVELAESRLPPAYLHYRTRLQNEAAIELSLLARERFPPRTAARSLASSRLAYTYELVGRRAEALEMAEDSIRDADGGGDPAAGAQARHSMVTVLSRAGRLEEAAALAREGREMARACGAAMIEGKHVATLGTILAMSGRTDEAIPFFREAASRFADLGSVGDEAIALGNLSQALAGSGSDEALPLARRSLQLAQQVGDALQALYAESNVGMLLAEHGDLDEAATILGQVASRSRALGVSRLLGTTFERRASALLAAGRLEEADAAAADGMLHRTGGSDPALESRLLPVLAEVELVLRGHRERAREILDQALDSAREHGAASELRHARLRLAALALRAGDEAAARAHVESIDAPTDALVAAWRARLCGDPAPDDAAVAKLPFDARAEALALIGRDAELAALEASVAERLAADHRAAFLAHGAPARARGIVR